MKKLMTIVGLILAINTVNAQQYETTTTYRETHVSSSHVPGGVFGVRFMPVFTSFDFKKVDNGVVSGDFVLGYGFGAVIGANFSEHVGLQVEVIYNTLSQKYKDMDLDRTVDVSYVNIPLLLVLNTGVSKPVNLNLAFGPQLGINAGSKVTTSGSNSEVDTLHGVFAVKKGDFGIAYGIGLDFAMGASARLSVGYRGVTGLIDVSDKSTSLTTDQYYILDRVHVNTNAAYIGLAFLF
jgi:hypothetical protein